MIPGVVASVAGTAPLSWNLNFADGVYRSRGASANISALIDHPDDIVADRGLVIGLDYPVAIMGDLLAYLLAGDWTIVIDWIRTDNSYCEPFRIADASDNNPRIGVQDDAGAFLAYELVVGDRDLPLSGTAGALAHSVIALTRTADHIAISRNGGTVSDNPTDGPVPLAMTAAWFGGGTGSGGGGPFSFGECAIRRFVVMASVDNVFLPGLSALTSLPPADVTGTLAGIVTPIGSFTGTFAPAGVSGALIGSVTPIGSFAGTFTPQPVTGTLAGSVTPAGSFSGTFAAGAPTTISARYWSINISAKVGAEAGVSELEFAQLGGTKIAGGTASATSTTGGFPASNAIDGSTSTAWVAGSGSLPQRLSVDFGSAVDVNVVRVKGRSAAVYPTTFTVDYSSDGISWTTAWTVTGADDGTYTDTPLPYPNPTATGGLKPLWRINVSATESGTLAVNEVEMRGSVGGTDLTGSGRPWCQTVGFSLPVTNAFDNNTSTTYHAAGASGVIGYEFTDSVSVVELYIYPRSGTPAQAPKNFTLQYSADGVTWTTAMSPAAQTGWTASVPRTFT